MSVKGYAIVAGTCVFAGVLAGYWFSTTKDKGPTGKIDPRFVAPSALELRCRDSDENGELETIGEYNGKRFFVMDEGGVPVFRPYEIDLNILTNNGKVKLDKTVNPK